jgi:hypothetical protein
MYILILKYILIALCLAYVTHVFSKKREVMLDVKRHVLEKRLKLYASLHKLIHHNSLLIAPPVILEQYYWSLIDGMPFRIGDHLRNEDKWDSELLPVSRKELMELMIRHSLNCLIH